MERVLPPDNDTPRQQQPDLPEPTSKPGKKRPLLTWLLWSSLLGTLVSIGLVGFAAFTYYTTIYPTLPDVSELKRVQMQTPLRIYTSDGKLLGEYGEKKRIPVSYEQLPLQLIQAVLAAEDDRFFQHPGVDYQGILRAAFELARTGSKSQGGSTITMQVARNFFLTPEKSFLRKFNEIILSLKIEHQLTKEEILTLYLNKIFLGHRSYGVAAAAQTYFGKPLEALSLDEVAILAGLPKAPSALNPISNPEACKNRRDYVLRRMAELGFISEEEKLAAQAKPITASLHQPVIEVNADYVAEMTRQWAVEKFGEAALEQGLTITTSIHSDLQSQAQKAIVKGVFAYERRHGYRGPVAKLDASAIAKWPRLPEELVEPEALTLALVTAFDNKTRTTHLKLRDGSAITLDAKATDWAKSFKEPGRKTYLQPGDVVYVETLSGHWQLAQLPRVQAALVSLDARTGALLALSGGYDFARNQFNRAVQAKRQPGSSFKPFLYTAALDKGYTPATIINDAPIAKYDDYSEDYWRPENYTGTFHGPTRMRMALAKSLNLVSIRILQDITIPYFLDYARGLGLDVSEMESINNLSIALGTATVSLLEHTGNYSMFANGGYRVQPWFISKVEDSKGQVLYQHTPAPLCDQDCSENSAPRVIKPTTHYLINSMLQDVVRIGTATRAKALNRHDLAGKTGTTNDVKDTWFMGYNPDIVTGVWMGFDQPDSLGKRESGGASALPIWIDYMALALKDKPDIGFTPPEGIVSKRIDPITGQLMPDYEPGGISEVFDENNLPALAMPDPLRELQHELF